MRLLNADPTATDARRQRCDPLSSAIIGICALNSHRFALSCAHIPSTPSKLPDTAEDALNTPYNFTKRPDPTPTTPRPTPKANAYRFVPALQYRQRSQCDKNSDCHDPCSPQDLLHPELSSVQFLRNVRTSTCLRGGRTLPSPRSLAGHGRVPARGWQLWDRGCVVRVVRLQQLLRLCKPCGVLLPCTSDHSKPVSLQLLPALLVGHVRICVTAVSMVKAPGPASPHTCSQGPNLSMHSLVLSQNGRREVKRNEGQKCASTVQCIEISC